MNDWPVNLFKFLDTLNCIDIKYINSVSSFEAFNEWFLNGAMLRQLFMKCLVLMLLNFCLLSQLRNY